MEKNRESILSPGLLTLLDNTPIRIWVRQNVQNLLFDYRYNGNRVYLENILGLRKIQKRILYSSIQHAKGELIVKEGGFAISLSSRLKYPDNLEEKRFTIAHEIGHTYFYDIQEIKPKRYSWLGSYTKSEEIICDTFASELLMPIDSLRNDFSLKNLRTAEPNIFIDRLVELSSMYCVSIYAMGLRIIRELEMWNGLLICCSMIGKYIRGKQKRSSSDIENIIENHEDVSLRIIWTIFPNFYDNNIFFHRPETNIGPYMKLRLNSVEDKYSSLTSHKSEILRIPLHDLFGITNIKKSFTTNNSSEMKDIGLMKIDRKHPFDIPLENIQTLSYGFDPIILIAIPFL